jgi:hypothetical protein
MGTLRATKATLSLQRDPAGFDPSLDEINAAAARKGKPQPVMGWTTAVDPGESGRLEEGHRQGRGPRAPTQITALRLRP